jgi:hypothetical protein
MIAVFVMVGNTVSLLFSDWCFIFGDLSGIQLLFYLEERKLSCDIPFIQ